jgi:thymidine phosphorylase
VAAGEPLATIYYNDDSRAAQAKRLMEASCEVADLAPAKRPLIHRVIGMSGEKN